MVQLSETGGRKNAYLSFAHSNGDTINGADRSAPFPWLRQFQCKLRDARHLCLKTKGSYAAAANRGPSHLEGCLLWFQDARVQSSGVPSIARCWVLRKHDRENVSNVHLNGLAVIVAGDLLDIQGGSNGSIGQEDAIAAGGIGQAATPSTAYMVASMPHSPYPIRKNPANPH
jgi:hypothetical protein